MRFRRNAQLDTGQVSDRRRAGAAPIAVGGGGVIGLVILVLTLLNGGDPSALNLGTGTASSDNTELSTSCRTGEDANQKEDCRIVGVINSVQDFWGGAVDGYEETPTVFFSQATPTGCGNATSAVGPFYCPVDKTVYIDLSFYDELRSRFGAAGGPFAEAYVIAHEYGHHIEDLEGSLARASQDRSTGPKSSSVRIELEADCYAGVWAAHAVDTGFIEELTEADVRDGLDAAAAVGDDRIQESVQGRVDPESFTHGTAEQRQRWFRTGYGARDVRECDTFATNEL